MNEIRVGLIGYGMAARTFHVPVMQSVPALALTKVVARHRDPATRYPAVEVVPDAAALLQDETIDLVVIATPNRSHFDLARQALLAGKHVVVEKPVTTTSAQAQQLIDLARQQNRLISVHHNRRWDGDFRTVQQLLAGHLLGRLVEYEAHYDRFRNVPRPNAWREEAGEGSGILYDLGAHLIDQAQVLFGLPQGVTADLRTQREFAQAIDNFDLTLHYDGLKVILKGGMLVRGQEPHFVLRGTAGSFIKYGMDPQEEALKRGLCPTEPDWGTEPRERWGTITTEVDGLHLEGRVETLAGCYPAYYQNVADAIAGRAELAVKPEEARDTIRIIELAMQSSEQNCTLPFSA